MRPMTKNMWRDIGKNRGRFIAIILIILLGVLIFVGVKAAGPGLNDSLDATVKRDRLSDVQMLSTTGFTTADVQTAEKVSGAQAEVVKFKYVLGQGQNAVALYGYDAAATQNKLQLASGHLPKQANEIVLDQRAKAKFGLRLGARYTFPASAKLKRRTYRIVGFADSPLYIDNTARGAANVGDGTVRYFAVIPAAQMNLPTATLLNVRFASLQQDNTYSATYKAAVRRKKAALQRVFKLRAKARQRALLADATKQLDPQQAKLTAAQKQLDAARSQVPAGQPVPSNISTQEKQLATAQAQLKAARQRAQTQAKTTYTWQTRSDLPGFSAYGDSSTQIAAIANVFPVFFFLIAALITFTTITRMIEEARSQIGTFKALGYGKMAIARNYLAYAFFAGMIGTIIGALLGNFTLPRIILALYSMYIPMVTTVPFAWGAFGLAVVFSLLATVGAAGIVVTRELAEGPAALMRPKAPKSAKRIWLEHITPLWRRLSFNQKVSYRNLFRYKSRMIMTIIGIAGGTALIMTGFGIQNSIAASATRQFGDVFHYQAVVRLKTSDDTKARHVLAGNAQYRSAITLSTNSAKIRRGSKQVNDVNLYVASTNAQLRPYVSLKGTRDKQLALPQSGIVLISKAARTLGAKKGSVVTLTPTGGKAKRVRVAEVTTNYMSHFAYLSQSGYRQLYGNNAPRNTLLVRLKQQTGKQRNALAHDLLDHGASLGTSYTHDQQQTVTNMAASLNPVIWIFILLSGILSFVVLYNLTNINVSERIRELSTIKVLGFYDREVTLYISRENIVLTIVGIICGYGVGNLLTGYILHQAETAEVVFPLIIHWPGYVTATLLMAIFTAIVIFVTHKRLQHVDMIEALKSNE